MKTHLAKNLHVIAACVLTLLGASCRSAGSKVQTSGGSFLIRNGSDGSSNNPPNPSPIPPNPNAPSGQGRGLPPGMLRWNNSGYQAASGLRANGPGGLSTFFAYTAYGTQVLVSAGMGNLAMPAAFPAALSKSLVANAYCRVLKRSPSPKEQDPYTANADVVYTVKAMVADLVESAEFQSTYVSDLSDSEQVVNLIAAILARPATPGELSSDSLAQYKSRPYTAYAELLLDSSEYTTNNGESLVPGGGLDSCYSSPQGTR